ncbi:DUF6053 domain-containing protein [Lysobacter enzymogenes]|uniref:DUF6053 domain-containing protein n=1 Tax=Lysobacter enzymogenes TaxID=69 RepID=UPI003D2F950C
MRWTAIRAESVGAEAPPTRAGLGDEAARVLWEGLQARRFSVRSDIAIRAESIGG